MAGFSDYMAQQVLDYETGRAPMAAIGSRFMALFTTAPNDSGAGGTEVTGGSYARVQVAGGVTASTAFTSGVTTTITVNTGQTWIVAGMNVYDTTNNKQVGTVQSYVSGTGVITLTAAASNSSSGSTDTLQISAWPASSASSGSEPSTTPANVTNGAIITFATATANWGTAVAFGLYDALSSGNFITFDFLGNFKWLPFTCTSASPGVFTSPAHGYSNNDPVVVTTKYGGTLPTTGGSFSGVLTVAGAATDTFNVSVNTTSTGDGDVRKIVQQSIPAGVTASFAASTATLSLA